MGFYAGLVRPLLFRLDPESAHRLAIASAGALGWSSGVMRRMTAVADPRLETRVAGLRFATPIGLAAGFDKSGVAIAFLGGLGFGSVEIGSVSADPSGGNPQPRLFRLPDDRAIAVAYGVPNDGAMAVAERVRGLHLRVPLGINIVKTNRGKEWPPEKAEDIIADYVAATRILAPFASYLMFNLSCPNTEDGRDFFADASRLREWLAAIGETGLRLPVFLKVSPLGGIEMIERMLAVADEAPFVSGFMYNLPPLMPSGLLTSEAARRTMRGAVSGPPSARLADFCIRQTYLRMDRKRHIVLGAGGVASAEDAYRKLKYGASLVQLLTSLVYEGPGVVRRITAGLLELLERDGVRHVSEVVGTEAGAKQTGEGK